MATRFGAAPVLFAALAAGCVAPVAAEEAPSTRLDPGESALWFLVDGQEPVAYRFGEEWAIPHLWPLRSPSGRDLLLQEPDEHPHHRSLWIVDRVQAEGGPETDFYHEWKNLIDTEDPAAGHHSFLRHDGFVSTGNPATATLTWLAHGEVVLSQTLGIAVDDLGNGEYFLHLAWRLQTAASDVHFRSDWVHYAWPYLRMHPAFCGEQGGTITDDQGRVGQEATNGQHARWVDYSNTVDGITEGLTVCLPPDGEPHRWLTREYGTFGPRRADAFDGTRFTLKRGDSLTGAVTILVHRGDVEVGQVVERYAELSERYGLTSSVASDMP